MLPPTIFHVLRDNEDRLLGNHSEEADEVHVLQVLHHVGLSQERFHRHRANLQALDGHPPLVVVDA